MARFIVVWMVAALLTGALVRAAVSPKNNPVDSYPTELGEADECNYGIFSVRLVRDLVNSRGQESHEPIRAYFTKYLKDCGLDDRFKTVLKYASDKKYGDDYALMDYLTRDDSKLEPADHMKKALYYVSLFPSQSQFDEPDCRPLTDLHNYMGITTIPKENADDLFITAFRECYHHLKVICQGELEKRVAAFKKNESTWALLQEFRQRVKPKNMIDSSEEIVKNIRQIINNESSTASGLRRACIDYCEKFDSEKFSTKSYGMDAGELGSVEPYCRYLLAEYEKKDPESEAME